MSQESEIERASNLFRQFQGRAPRGKEIIRVSGYERPWVALQVGILQSIGYRATGNSVDYFHEFEAEKPTLCVSETGRQIFIMGGGYRFTDRGFIK